MSEFMTSWYYYNSQQLLLIWEWGHFNLGWKYQPHFFLTFYFWYKVGNEVLITSPLLRYFWFHLIYSLAVYSLWSAVSRLLMSYTITRQLITVWRILKFYIQSTTLAGMFFFLMQAMYTCNNQGFCLRREAGCFIWSFAILCVLLWCQYLSFFF